MTQFLKLPQLAQGDGVSEVDVRGCRIDAELHAKRTPQSELCLEFGFAEYLGTT